MTGAGITRSLRDRQTGQVQWAAVVVYTALVLAIAYSVGPRLGAGLLSATDSTYYLNMAHHIPADLPFASRQLAPLIVRGISHVLHISIEASFIVEGVVALFVFVATVGALLAQSGAPRWTLVAAGGIAFWTLNFSWLALPDVLYVALLGIFLLLLWRQRMLAAALMMFPLMVSRESTLLTLVCFLLAGWRRLRILEVVAAVGSMAAGMLLVKHLTLARQNIEHISPMLYMIGKMPWNFARNVLGIDVWANLNQPCKVPQWQTSVHLGPVHAIGYCGFIPLEPVLTLAIGLGMFGLFPLLLIRLRKVRMMTGGRADMLLRFAVIYGMISFLLAPILGASVDRLFAYSWPLFLVGLPILLGLSKANFTSPQAAMLFVALHLALSWLIFVPQPAPQLLLAGVVYALGWALLRRSFREGISEPAGALET
jgi:hypothetical protein